MATVEAQIQEIYIGLLGRAGDQDGAAYWAGQIESAILSIEQVRENIVNSQPEYAAGLGSMTRAQAVTELYDRLFERLAEAAGLEYWVNGEGNTVPFDILVLALSNGAGASERLVLDNKSEAAQFYTSNTPTADYSEVNAKAAVDSVDGTTASVDASKAVTNGGSIGETKTLTSAAETLTGTAKDDSFLASASDTNSSTDTFNAGDTLDGSGGIDSLNLTVSGTNNNFNAAAASVSNIEIINTRAVLTNTATTTTLQASNFSGATEFYADRASSAVVISVLETGQAGGIKGNGAVANGSLNLNYVNSATSGIINLSGGTTQGSITQSGTGITSNTINSTGTEDNILSNISLSGSANVALTINAEASLESGNITGFTGTESSITLSGAAENIAATATQESIAAVDIGSVEANTVKTIDASGLTNGGLGVVLSSNAAIQVTGGAGNDSIMTGAVLTTGSVDASDGDADLLAVSSSAYLASNTLGAKYTNFEVLRVVDGVSVDLDNISGITSVEIIDAASNNTGFTNLSATQAGAIQVLAANGRMEASVKGAATNGQLDTVTMTFDNGNTTTKEDINGSGSTIISQDVETFNFVAIDHIEISNTQQMSNWTAINFSGEGDIDLTTGSQSIIANSIFTSTTTGNATLDAQDSSNFGINVTTGSGNDSIKMANNDLSDIINTGAGDDVIYANGSGTTGSDGDNLSTDTITSGTGLDTIHLSLGGGANPTNIDFITDLDLGTITSAVDSLVFRDIGSSTTEVVIAISTADQANISAQGDLRTATDYVLNNFATNDGNVSMFAYGSDDYLIVNGDGGGTYSGSNDALIKVTGITGTLDSGDFSFT
jgi:hypothetical protein